jgi:hypothetical protein
LVSERAEPELKGGAQLLAVLGVALLISIAIGVAYAISILPEIRAQRMTGNEASAVESLIRIKTAQTLYRETANPNHPPRYGDLQELEAARLLDVGFVGRPKQGYVFEAGAGADPTRRWWAKASPQFVGKTGRRYYFVDQTGLISVSEADFPVPPPASGLPPGLQPIGQ